MDAGQSLLAPSSNQEPNGAVPAVPLQGAAICEPAYDDCLSLWSLRVLLLYRGGTLVLYWARGDLVAGRL